METTTVNWESLDSLVIDFVKSEKLIEDSPTSCSLDSASSSEMPPLQSSSCLSPSSPCVSSSSYHSRLIIRQIRRCIEVGDLDSATDLLRSHAPFLLQDRRIFFRLQKQKFIELLRLGTVEARDAAIGCIRQVLAPCALDAYPEAYEEFKHVLLAFIYDKNDKISPVASEWEEKRRFEIAGLMSSVLRAHLHVYDPVFSMTLRYLISIHKSYCLRQGLRSPISDLTDRLLMDDRDPPAVPVENLLEVPPFDEVDIQALAHAVELTRQGAVESLKFVRGDLFQAFQNELCRMKLDICMLDQLVREYCVYRGIVDSGLTFTKDLGCISSRNVLHEEGHSLSHAAKFESSRSTDQIPSSPESSVDTHNIQGNNLELRCCGDQTGEDCCTSMSLQPANTKTLVRNRHYMAVDRNKRKRWKGRQENGDYTSSISSTGYHNCDSKVFTSSSSICEEAKCVMPGVSKEEKYEIALEIKELASRGMTTEVIEAVNSMDPSFFVQNATFLFQLKKIEFLKLVGSGDNSGALRVASSYLGPLAASDPDLLQPLKETLLELLLPSEGGVRKDIPLHSLATSLQVAVGHKLGIEEPQLMKIMRATIYTHNEWFKLQMCKDRFESILRIDCLKELDSPLLTSSSFSKSNGDCCTQGSSLITDLSCARGSEDSTSPNRLPSSDYVYDENAILKVMEFVALPRADAIHLLEQFNGNAESVIHHIFS